MTRYGVMKMLLVIERIIGQWLNGNRSGEIIGLEGPPGTGKTSYQKRFS